MNPAPRPFFTALVTLLLAVTTLQAASETKYTQDFANKSTTSNQLVSTAKWLAYAGDTAVDLTTTGKMASEKDRASIASGPGPDGSPGFLFVNNPATPSLNFAAIALIDPVFAETISWKMGNTSDVTVRLLIKQGADWYASDASFSTAPVGTAAEFASLYEMKSVKFSPASSNWRKCTILPGDALQLGDRINAPLKSDTITGIGFYIVNSRVAAIARFDDLVITGR